jgi:poly(A) polymerase
MDPKRQEAVEIIRQIRESGFQAFFVGGCVRDLIMGRPPGDYDVTTDAHPEAVLRLFPEGLTVGVQFGVVIVPRSAGNVEVATFRRDGRYTDGRHPDRVVYSKTPQEDAQRRDFTINGLLFDPLENKVLDFVGGQADIRLRRVRTIGDPFARFAEDRLRMLRAVRFAARFDFQLEAKTAEAIRQLAPEIRDVSAERMGSEIIRILTEGKARRGFQLLDETRLLSEVLAEVKAMQGVEQPPEFHPEGDVWTHTLIMLDGLKNSTPTLALAVLLHDVGKPPTFTVRERIRFDHHAEVGAKMAEAICERLRLSSRDTERVAEMVRHHLRFKDFPNMRRATQLRFIRMDNFEEHLELHRLDCLASHGDLTNYELAKRLLQQTSAEEARPARLVTGNDLIQCGYAPGPRFTTILRSLEDAQLEGRILTREDAIRFLREQFPLTNK